MKNNGNLDMEYNVLRGEYTCNQLTNWEIYRGNLFNW